MSHELQEVPGDAELLKAALAKSAGDGGMPLDHVELDLPVRPELWALARISASAIAARLDFGVDAVEDLRLAIDELCNSCAAGATPDSRLSLEYLWGEDLVHVVCTVAPAADAGSSADDVHAELELSGRILDALVDEHDIGDVSDGIRRGWLTKCRPQGR